MRSSMMIVLIIMATTTARNVALAETSVATEANLAVEYNDNIRLTPQSGQDAVGRYASAGAKFFLSRPEQEIRVNPSIHAQRYAGAPSLDNDDYFLDIAADRQLERSALSLQGNYYRDTTLTNDIDSTGLVEIGVRRERSGIRPAWTLELAPESRLKLGLGYDKVAYAESTALGTTVDYDFTSASLSYGRELAQGDELSATLSADRLEAPDISNRADHQGVQMDYAVSPAERVRVSATLGLQRSRFARGTAPLAEESGALIGFRLIGEGEYRVANLALTRSIEPSGTGTLMQSDNLSFSLASELSPRLTSDLALLLSDRTDLQGIDPNSDRVLGQVRIGFGWRLAEGWDLSAVYRFVRQRYVRTDIEADSNALMFFLSFTGDQTVLVR